MMKHEAKIWYKQEIIIKLITKKCESVGVWAYSEVWTNGLVWLI